MHEAKRMSAAPFDVLQGQTIREIAAVKPRTPSDLRSIAGIGGDWADRHGEAVCAVIAQYAADAIHLVK